MKFFSIDSCFLEITIVSFSSLSIFSITYVHLFVSVFVVFFSFLFHCGKSMAFEYIILDIEWQRSGDVIEPGVLNVPYLVCYFDAKSSMWNESFKQMENTRI